MKIIREGNVPPEPVWEGACTHCNCAFECEEREMRLVLQGDHNWWGSEWKKVRGSQAICPTCGRPVQMQKKVVR